MLKAGIRPRAISRVVRRLAHDAAVGGDYSAHSLRAGFATTAYAVGLGEREIQEHDRRNDRRSISRYIDVSARQRLAAARLLGRFDEAHAADSTG